MLQIRKGHKSDLPAVFGLIQELARYEKALEEVETSVEQFEIDGFGDRPFFDFFVAEDSQDGIVGVALFYLGYSTWKGRMLYLDDLVITQSWRRKGLGRKLMDRLVAHAKKEGVRQMRWHVLDWNEPAIRLYKKIAAELDQTWITCKLSAADLESWKPMEATPEQR